jgi:hypothetical protein
VQCPGWGWRGAAVSGEVCFVPFVFSFAVGGVHVSQLHHGINVRGFPVCYLTPLMEGALFLLFLLFSGGSAGLMFCWGAAACWE